MSEIPDVSDLMSVLDLLEEPEAAETDATLEPESPPTVSVGDDLGAFLDAATDIHPATKAPAKDDDDDLATFIQNANLKQEKTVNVMRRPWMDEHKFVIIKSVEELRSLVDAALASGKCALDLETHGLDNRIYWRTPEDFTDRSVSRARIRAQDKSEIAECFWSKGSAPETVHKIVGYCLCHDGETGYYVPIRHTAEDSGNLDPGEAAQEIRRLCLAAQPTLTADGMRDDPLGSRQIAEPGKVKLFFWHAKFDQEFLYPITGLEYWHPDSFECGNLFYFCKFTNDKSLSLKDKAPQLLRSKKGQHPYDMIDLKELFVNSAGKKRAIDFASLNPIEAYEYGSSDAICTYLLCDRPENVALLSDQKTPKHISITGIYRLEKQVAQTLRGMERPRIQLEIEYVKELLAEAVVEANKYKEEVDVVAKAHGWHDLDLKSSKQLSEFLFTEKGLNVSPKPPINEASGQYKTDADTLEGLVEDHKDAPAVLISVVKFRQVDKVISTYLTSMLNNCDSNSEIRYQFKQTGAATARFSAPAGKPEQGYGGVPIHGIPGTYDEKKPKVATSLRKAFKARTGYTMVKVDFAGEELRIATNLAQEPVWINEFLNGSGDLHSITARAFFNKKEISKQERQMGKTANFALLYGGGANAIIRATGCTQVEAQRRKANFDKALPAFAKWTRRQKAMCLKEGGVWTAFKRWIEVPEIASQEKKVQAGAERASVNYPIQGTGADIMKMAMVLLHKDFHKRGWLPTQGDIVRMLMTVHDEIVFEVRHEFVQTAMEVIIRLMEEPGRLAKWRVPLIAEALLDSTWDAKYDWTQIMVGTPINPDKPPKETDIVHEGRVYGKLPPWLEDHLTPPWKLAGVVAPQASPTPQGPLEPSPATLEPQSPRVAPEAHSTPPSASIPKPTPTTATPAKALEVCSFRITTLTPRTVRQVAAAYMFAECKTGPVLEVRCGISGEVLVSTSLHLQVDPEEFQRQIDTYNL